LRAQIEYLRGEVKRLRELHAALERAGKGKALRVEVAHDRATGKVNITCCDPRGNTAAQIALLSATTTQLVAVLNGTKIEMTRLGESIALADAAEGAA